MEAQKSDKNDKAASVIFDRIVEDSTLKSRGAATALALTAVSLIAELNRLREKSRLGNISDKESRTIATIAASQRETLRMLGVTEREYRPRRPQLSDLEAELKAQASAKAK